MLAYRSTMNKRTILRNEMKGYLAVDELNVIRALCNAVPSSVFSAGLLSRVFLERPLIGVHLRKVKCAVKATGKVGHVDIEGELLVLQVEHLIAAVVGHKVHARAGVGGDSGHA